MPTLEDLYKQAVYVLSRSMLARRVVTRPATTLRLLGASQPQRRFIFPSRPHSQAPRPDTWLAKLRFRADGNPRTKSIGFAFGTLILFNFLSYCTLLGKVDSDELTYAHLVKMIYIQQTDTTYDSVDFDDHASTLSYFKKLFLSVSLSSKPEEADEFFSELMVRINKKRTRKDSKIDAEMRAYQIMRLAAEKIHGALRELNQDSIPTTAQLLMDVMMEALSSLADLSYYGDDDDISKHFQIRNNIEKDAKPTKDYEVLG